MKIINNNKNCIFEIAEFDEIKIDEKYIVGKVKKLKDFGIRFHLRTSLYGFFIGCCCNGLNPYENDVLFEMLELNKTEFQNKILGYIDPNINFNNFPYCKTQEDALKLLNALIFLNYKNYENI